MRAIDMHAHCTILAFQYSQVSALPPTLKFPAKSKVELEPDWLLLKQSSRDLLALPSQECNSWQTPAELPIGDRAAPELSGLVISFGKTLPYLPQKTVTRRAWKDGHAKKFANAFDRNKLVKAFDKDRRYGGKQIGWCRLLCAPYKEKLCDMPPLDLKAEGGMCQSIGEFVGRYFKGDSSFVVWVIRFEFIPNLQAYINRSPLRDVSPAFEGAATSNFPLILPIESIHQASLVPLGVYPALAKQTNTNSPIPSVDESIHQASSVSLGVYPAFAKQTNTNSPIPSLDESIHQASLVSLGVYPGLGKQANTSSPILSRIDSIHQDSLNPLGVYQPPEHQTNIKSPISSRIKSIHQASSFSLGVYPALTKQSNTNSPIPSPIKSIHQPSLVPFGVYPAPEKQTNTNSPIPSPAESIHQSELAFLGVYQPPGKQTNINSPIHPTADSIHQGLSTESQTTFSMCRNETPRFEAIGFGASERAGNQIDSNPPVTLRTESIHQAPLEALPTLDLSQFVLPRNNTKVAIVPATESIHQNQNEKLDGWSGDCDSSDTNSAIPTASESTDASPAVQGGSGLVYSFWKGESIVNHYRYKVNIGGKWKVKSIYIPVGKLPQVKEAIANKLGVAAIVLKILCKKL
ncbi:hypothetical protein [Microcoleus sp. PH2017_02_FOX_O_A]|uniref:hypothetical protein n=2 Tax=unclassified Microcoleus TaxID=2642155 RepID=UPI0025D822D9|nr:hypothetical protein [Microcoleus sp. PH2017_02_FOX_O_A]